MTRLVDEPVVVRLTDADPSTFLWRDRIYVVRAVLGRWQERRAWWTSQAAREVHGTGHEPVAAVAGEARVLAPGTKVPLEPERAVWRVEAGAGRSTGWGTYDLCRDSPPSGPDSWRLLRIAD